MIPSPPTEFSGDNWQVLVGDVRQGLFQIPDSVVHCVVTSPPYWGLRTYGTEPQIWGGDAACPHEWGDSIIRSTEEQFCIRCGAWRGELGSEPTPELFIEHLVEVFREVRRVLRDDGVCFINLGDSYCSGTRISRKPSAMGKVGRWQDAGQGNQRTPSTGSLKPKDLCLMPWRFAIAAQADGWYVRDAIAWVKPAPMPESIRDRCTKSWEPILMCTKSAQYYWDWYAIRETAICPQMTEAEYAAALMETSESWYCRQDGPPPGENKSDNCGMNGKSPPGGRNPRNVWTLPPSPFPQSHFAVFPPSLPERCIKAATSERGCCGLCGAPYVRMVKSFGGSTRSDWNERRNGAHQDLEHGASANRKNRETYGIAEKGWRPGCDCDSEIVPCLVLDPFSGSATTGLAANELGRQYLGIELNPEYAAMSKQRINSWRMRELRTLQPLDGQMALFSESG